MLLSCYKAMKQLAIRITDELHKALKLAAVERGTNVTAIIIEAVKAAGVGNG
jgi:predicted HicB family RNase H-like nuclease